MFITPAYAQGAGGNDFFISLLPFIAIFAIMYFLIIRPQQKRLKDHREMVAPVELLEKSTRSSMMGKFRSKLPKVYA